MPLRRSPTDAPPTWTRQDGKGNEQQRQRAPYSKGIIVALLFVIVLQSLQNNNVLLLQSTETAGTSNCHHIGVVVDNNDNAWAAGAGQISKSSTPTMAAVVNQHQQLAPTVTLLESKFNVPHFHANLGISTPQGHRMHPHPDTDKAFVGIHPTEAPSEQNEYVQLGIETALKIATNQLPQDITSANNNDSSHYEQVAEWRINTHVLRQQQSGDGGCIVYSFGVGQDDYYTNFMAKYCSVFAFDPSVTTYDRPNVTFFPYGLAASSTTLDKAWKHPVYGSVDPSRLKTLPAIINELNHHGSTIAAIKFDCEGCEFGAFRDMRQLPNKVLSYQTEFHMTTTLGMNSMQDVGMVGEFGAFFRERSCRVASYKPNKGYEWDRTVFPMLVSGGVPDGTCCYEYTFTCDR